jgi:predicted esterase
MSAGRRFGMAAAALAAVSCAAASAGGPPSAASPAGGPPSAASPAGGAGGTAAAGATGGGATRGGATASRAAVDATAGAAIAAEGTAVAATAVEATAVEATAVEATAVEATERWCAPEFEALAGEVCAFVPPRESDGPRTLVIFLHGLVVPGSGWQWNQQRAAARAAGAHGFAVLMPRAVRGRGPKAMGDVWGWPGGASADVEAAIVAAWQAARAELEARDGRPFERVWVFGYSSGAYYASSLALRGRLAGGGPLRVDGFAAFAGGGGASPAIEAAARRARARTPLFVAWGERDRSHRDPMRLAAMLRRVGWPAKGEASPKAGHAMTDAQAAAAVRFLAGSRAPRRGPEGGGERRR